MDGCDEEGRKIRHAPQVVIVQLFIRLRFRIRYLPQIL